MAETIKIIALLVNDEYGSSKGGISTVNREVAKLLRKGNVVVYNTVLYPPPKEDIECAESDGVILLTPFRDPDDPREPCIEWLTYDHMTRYRNLPERVDIIVGHFPITSQAAKNISARYPDAKTVLCNHIIPFDTDHFKGNAAAIAADGKEKRLTKEAKDVHAVFSVGKRIHNHYDNHYRVHDPPISHHLFLPRPSETFANTNVRYGVGEKIVLTVGRVTRVERLKGLDIAAKAMGKVVEKIPNARLRVRGIASDDYARSKKILEDNLDSGKLTPTLLPYGTEREIIQDIKQAHLVLMPSRAEPFGMVGLEAIVAGIPVLISDQSGLADLMRELMEKGKVSADFRHKIVTTSVRESDLEQSAQIWADKIVDILDDMSLKSEFKKAAQFKKELLASKYWEESHKAFLEACCGTK
ncbi:D-inositol 3-phosphate glycosyltransferase-like [Branchiostoma lanceolatum]|uniref:D-inositol 3-phosphate glycosyltransferase-like n=1 Tax=Branchiostoma lanceolatum TaxID=7740 RepID=UPI0034527A3D